MQSRGQLATSPTRNAWNPTTRRAWWSAASSATANWQNTPDETRSKVATAEPPADLGEGMWTSWLTDPDGYRIELVQWPPATPPA
ncbi:hypothetical protein GCM10010170_076600 [Dactylosporangium salmoneum]|uniref:VOC domain-containing protein n=1 Tax=Dactylosporangium salmoneum TaxID=53361 RepID=A0ABP5UBR0_9ACTN